MKKLLLLSFIIFNSVVFAQFDAPKRELRGVWIASLGIDWPGATGTSSTVIQNQKTQLISILDSHKSYGLNAVFFHVRPICDAVYKSSYEPWSSYLTGTQGTPPSDTNYDPLQFAIQQAHQRGMELHAWLNPYRAELSGGSQVSANHVINKHPDWIIKCNGSQYRFLDPGLPEVRQYVLRIVMDIVERYDVDGIHFDDYFYPYTDYGTFNDDATFAKYPNGFTDRVAWRKNNVDLLLKMIYDSIKVVKPWVKFGVSPSGNPSVNSSIFINPADWLAGTYTDSTGTAHTGEPYVDYIMPQLYWERYNNQLGSWDRPSFLNGRHLYVGQAAYRYNSFSPGELTWEIMMNRGDPTVEGGVFFSSNSLTSNFGNCNDTLEYHYFTHPALTPKMQWKNTGNDRPNAPLNLRFEVNSTTGKYELHWDTPAPSAGDTAFVYVVYRSVSNPPDTGNASEIFGLTGQNYLSSSEAKYSVTSGNYYAVTAVDRYSNESAISNVVSLDLASLVPGNITLTSPPDKSNDLSTSTTLGWSGDSNAERYLIQVSTDSTFNSNLVLLMAEYRNTKVSFTSIVPGQTYYWRVNAFGQVGQSGFSDVHSFESGIPVPPVLSLPAHASTDVSLTPVFSWYPVDSVSSYRVQVSTAVQFYSNSIIVDTTVTDTAFTLAKALSLNKIYYWRANAKNNYGTSSWSDGFGFKTTAASAVEAGNNIPLEFRLEQNYPNPFNPTTKLSFVIGHSSFVSLKVYDVLGREIETLVNEEKPAGIYRAEFDGSKLASGIYFYQIKAGDFIQTRKMLLTK